MVLYEWCLKLGIERNYLGERIEKEFVLRNFNYLWLGGRERVVNEEREMRINGFKEN